MKNLKLKTIEIVKASKLLDEARYQEMTDEDKIKLWKISRKLKPITDKYLEDELDANKKLISSEDFDKKMKKGMAYEDFLDKKGEGKAPISEEEYKEIKKEYIKHRNLVNKALKELQSKEEEIEFEPLSETAFSKLMASNDWKLKELDLISFLME